MTEIKNDSLNDFKTHRLTISKSKCTKQRFCQTEKKKYFKEI